MIKLEKEIKKGCFTIIIKEPSSSIFLWARDVSDRGVLYKLNGNDLNDMIEIAREVKTEREILREKYNKAVKAIA